VGVVKWFDDEQGASLVFTLMTMVVLSALGITLGTIAINNVRLTSQERDYQVAFYVAEAGLNEAYIEALSLVEINSERFTESDSFFDQLIQDLNTTIHNHTYNNYEVISNTSPVAEVAIDRIEGSGNKRDITLISTGNIGERSQKVSRTFSVTWQDRGVLPYIPPNTTGMVRASIDLSTSIDGDLYLNDLDGPIQLDWGSSVDGTIFIPEGYNEDLITAPNNFNNYPDVETHVLSDTFLTFEEIIASYPAFNYPTETMENIQLKGGQDDALTITSDTYIESITIKSNRTLTINTEGNMIDLYVDQLEVPQGNININGGGVVNLYVSELFDIGQRNGGGSSQINASGETRQLNIYYSGTSPLNIGGGNAINGSLFNLQADLTFTNGFSFTGFLVSGGSSLTIQGGASNDAFIVAPKATVRLEQGGLISGFVAADQLITTGGARLSVAEIDTITFPFGSGGSTGGTNQNSQVEVVSEPPVLRE
jgi:Tfp pilus assembly protein PilX